MQRECACHYRRRRISANAPTERKPKVGSGTAVIDPVLVPDAVGELAK